MCNKKLSKFSFQTKKIVRQWNDDDNPLFICFVCRKHSDRRGSHVVLLKERPKAVEGGVHWETLHSLVDHGLGCNTITEQPSDWVKGSEETLSWSS